MEIIAQYIKQINQGVLPELDNEMISKLMKDYPSFHTAYTLKALQLKQVTDSEAFDAFLPNAAIHVPNRAKLYDLIHNNYQKSTQAEPSTTIEKEDEELQAILNDAEEQINEKQAEATKEAEQERSTESTQQNKLVPKQKDALKEERLQKEERIDLKTLVSEVKAKQEKKAKPSKLEKAAKQKSKAKTKPKKKSVKKVKEVLPKAEPTSFVEWLKTKNQTTEVQKTAETKTKTVKKEVKEELIPIDPTASHEALLHQESKKHSFKLEDFLIDQIEKKQGKRSQKTTNSTFGTSETYAQILEQQGNFEKAIEVYKELSIKYPKKSTNFASQIEKLKNNL